MIFLLGIESGGMTVVFLDKKLACGSLGVPTRNRTLACPLLSLAAQKPTKITQALRNETVLARETNVRNSYESVEKQTNGKSWSCGDNALSVLLILPQNLNRRKTIPSWSFQVVLRPGDCF